MLIAPMRARLNAAGDLKSALNVALADVVALLGAEKGNIQLLDAARQLVIVARLGLSGDFVRAFGRVSLEAGTACARAASQQRTVFVGDVGHDASFAPFLPLARAVPFRAALSSPIVTSDRRLLGVVSAHFANRVAPSPLELHTLERYCVSLADVVLARLDGRELADAAEALAGEVLAQAA